MDPAPPVYAALDALGIPYQQFEHPPVFTSDEAEVHWRGLPGVPCKNLFLRNKKGDRHYLAVVPIAKRVDLKELLKTLGDDRLSFGSPERLMAELGLTPGSVSPFGLLNDADGSVIVIVDEDLRGSAGLIFHPNINTASVVVSWEGIERFLKSRSNTVRHLRI